nr:hypothetical protein GCM10020092_034740 [Actinoplanes digitatis]
MDAASARVAEAARTRSHAQTAKFRTADFAARQTGYAFDFLRESLEWQAHQTAEELTRVAGRLRGEVAQPGRCRSLGCGRSLTFPDMWGE